MDYQDRIILEKSIIAELLSDPNAFVKVAGYLVSTNFTEPVYSEIYKACVALYPNKVIEPFTVAEESGYPVLMLLMEATHEILQNKNIQYRSLMLIEISIREQFISLIENIIEERKLHSADNTAFMEILTYTLDPETDIFKSIANTLRFLEHEKYQYEDEYTAVNTFNENIVKKCQKIRSSQHVKSLYYNLENLYQFDYRKKDLLMALSNLTRYVMANDITPELTSHIMNLSTI